MKAPCVGICSPIMLRAVNSPRSPKRSADLRRLPDFIKNSHWVRAKLPPARKHRRTATLTSLLFPENPEIISGLGFGRLVRPDSYRWMKKHGLIRQRMESRPAIGAVMIRAHTSDFHWGPL